MFKLKEQPISKQCTKCGIFKPTSEYCIDKNKKDGLYSSCKDCKNKKNREYKKKNPIKIKAYNDAYRKDNKDNINIKSMDNYYANRENILAIHKQYRKDNKQKCRAVSKKYYQSHKIDWYIKKANRRALKNNATVSYADTKAIMRKYRVAQILGIINKRKYEVDHIIPLNHPLVCGLHHEDNLQILTMEHNRRKHNHFNTGD